MASFRPDVQFLVSRGYGVLEVNYRGSTGYGRAYAQALRGAWGQLDVDDLLSAADYLAAEIADPGRIGLIGTSAAGYSVLAALCRPEGRRFRAAVVAYAVTDLLAMAADTHKFEAHYLDGLVGPLPAAAALYRERSPLHHAERIGTPLAIFQGEDDRVVPVAQAETIVAALRASGLDHEYHRYPGEGHGWRRAETIAAYFSAVERFLARHLA